MIQKIAQLMFLNTHSNVMQWSTKNHDLMHMFDYCTWMNCRYFNRVGPRMISEKCCRAACLCITNLFLLQIRMHRLYIDYFFPVGECMLRIAPSLFSSLFFVSYTATTATASGILVFCSVLSSSSASVPSQVGIMVRGCNISNRSCNSPHRGCNIQYLQCHACQTWHHAQ